MTFFDGSQFSEDTVFIDFSDTEAIMDFICLLLLETPKVQEIYKDAESIPREWREKYIEEAMKVYRHEYALTDMWYLLAKTVYLFPGSVEKELETDEVFLLAQQRIRLDWYPGNLFVFRDEARSAILEIQVAPNNVVWNKVYRNEDLKRYADAEWPADISEIKVMDVEEYRNMLARMQAK